MRWQLSFCEFLPSVNSAALSVTLQPDARHFLTILICPLNKYYFDQIKNYVRAFLQKLQQSSLYGHEVLDSTELILFAS